MIVDLPCADEEAAFHEAVMTFWREPTQENFEASLRANEILQKENKRYKSQVRQLLDMMNEWQGRG